jgi:hypothetical protein
VNPLTETSPLVEQRLLPNTQSQATKEKRIHTGEHRTHMAHIPSSMDLLAPAWRFLIVCVQCNAPRSRKDRIRNLIDAGNLTDVVETISCCIQGQSV